ncbi:metal-dependent hydrolase [Sulfobacillus sp. hq2]|uniref:metal-dependent hydrolase n=1 Tax=Sulfobacillus TaxID=28033 RepID=UPI000CD2B239|nr:metal-dependent hydrolase [Sulfobacillus sp. hq2]POB09683.1 hypothetical protein CO251_15890 [Sulfobacillus sp. hq2]
MLGKTHIVAGVGAAVTTAALIHAAVTPDLVILGGLGGLAPDLDHPQALLTRHLLGASTASSVARSTGWVRHRGVAHSVVALMLTTWILLPWGAAGVGRLLLALGAGIGHPGWISALDHIWGPGLRIGWGAGYASHMLVDILNTKGVQWFWPLNLWIKSPIPNITVGTWPETVFRWGLIMGLVYWNPWLGLITAGSSELIYRGVKAG